MRLTTLLFLLFFVSANAGWQTQKTYWPRLTYEAADVPIIKEHYQAALNGVEPYKTLWARVQKQAGRGINSASKEWGVHSANGANIKAKALIYVLTGDKAQADQVRDTLLGMYTGEQIPAYGISAFATNFTAMKNLKSSVMQSIHMSQVLVQHCQAYDMLKGAGYPFGASEAKIRENMAVLTGRLYDLSNWITSGGKSAGLIVDEVQEQNNFQLKICSAIAMATMCLNDNPNAEKWINRAVSKFWQVYSAQTTPQGGYGEGPFYYVYAGQNFLPFFRAFNLFLDGQGGTFEGYKIPNFLSDDRVAAVTDWHIKIRMPSGDRPGFDDGYYAGFPAAMFVSEPNFSGHATDHHAKANLAMYAWDWQTVEQFAGGYDNRLFSEFANLDLTADMFCFYDADVKPAAPGGSPTVFFPEAGSAVMRSGWETNAVYLHLLAENGAMRAMGAQHEHPDAGSFVLYAYGELLAIDAGYPGYPQHAKVNEADNHNTLLVDGTGPTTDAFIKDTFDSPACDGATVAMNYGGADLTRHVFFVDNKYVLVNDDIKSPASHQYTWLLHGYAGGQVANSTFKAAGNNATWTRPKASLNAWVYGANTTTTDNLLDYHSITFAGQNELPQHAVWRAKQSGTRGLFASVLAPTATGTTAPTVQSLPCRSGLAVRLDLPANETLINLVRGDSALVKANSGVAAIGDVSSDADVVVLVGGASPRTILMKNGTRVRLGAKTVALAAQRCQLLLTYDAAQKVYRGQIIGGGQNTIQIPLAAAPKNVTGAQKSEFDAAGKMLKVQMAGAGAFTVGL